MKADMILGLTNLFFAGILAGIEISVHYGFHSPTVALDEKPQIQLRQGVIRRLRWLVPAFFVPTALTGIALTIADGMASGFPFRLVALLALLVWIIVRVVGTVRINSATLEWNPDSPPGDWRAQIAAAERFHIVGTWAAILAFACFLIALAYMGGSLV
jgi:hypothetical protein